VDGGFDDGDWLWIGYDWRPVLGFRVYDTTYRSRMVQCLNRPRSYSAAVAL